MTNKEPIRIFTARACAAPLEEASRLFTADSGIAVAIDTCNRHCAIGNAEEAGKNAGTDDFLTEISDMGIHDLAIGGAEYLLDDGEVRGIIRKGERRLIANRASAIVVPKGNPANIKTLSDLAKPGVRVSISVLDCLKGLWEDVCGRQKLLAGVGRNVTFRANGCIAIVEAVAQKKVDAAIGWTAFRDLDPDGIEVVPLPAEQVVERGTGVGMLSFCRQEAPVRKFMDFLTTPKARNCYYSHGWVKSE